ncbi:hypothetical protein NMT24_003443 [Vibrio cholerae]|uniref:hypothetical protein n=1 Tax=Vibrio mimicus TaxID=674 RepID=UPI0001BAE1AC|nr:hypothetical protein [Vibrio mimicus]EHU0376649.1 hypothetical protein [Vibrio cholerae]EEY46607.1 hypothetical protein VMA_000078 [Vibrio mimicus VM223]EJL6278900.1 hypothetical protein [Vibrio cholerae]EJL6583063.1 hypothetical protein [Vibrio cholerae]EJL6841766.1 hypothetical protein [Vibrio cholerae]
MTEQTNIEQPQLPGLKESVELRIEIIYKTRASRFSAEKVIHEPVQGKPVIVLLRVSNLSNKICKGFKVVDAVFHFQSDEVVTSVDHNVQVPPINPKSSIDVELDHLTFNLGGACWFSCSLEPDSKEQEFVTFQHDRNHDKDALFKNLNAWGEILYIEGRLASLQAETNRYILILTIITVLEAVFGLKNLLNWGAVLLSTIFGYLAEFFVLLASIT